MRIDCDKVLIVGPASVKDLFFERAQRLGIIEFIPPQKRVEERAPDVETFIHALHILRKRPVTSQLPPGDYRAAVVIATDIVDKNEASERFREERRILEKEKERIAAFGRFSPTELNELAKETGRVFQFFFAKKTPESDALDEENLFRVGSRHGLNYFFAINPEKRSYPGLIEMTVDKSVEEVESELAAVNRKIANLEDAIDLLSHHQQALKRGLVDALNHSHLHHSKERTLPLMEGEVFSVQGWVPKNKTKELIKLCDELNVWMSPIQIEEGDRHPTYLENEGAARWGEDLIGIYDIPSAGDRDPSLWVYSAFLLFFSMIIGDAGYGLVLLGISLFLFFKYGKKPGLGRRVIKMSISLSIGCIIWGVLGASFFGVTFEPNSKFRSLSLIDWMVDKKAEYLIKTQDADYQQLVKKHPELQGVTNPRDFVMAVTKKKEGALTYTLHEEFADNVMLELVLFIGTIHIMLSLLRYVDRNWAAIGWVIFMVGAYLKFPAILRATSLIHYIFHVPPVLGAQIGLYMIFVGIGLATLLALIQRKWAGLEEPTKVIGVFADVMSYLRIYALALAGVIMAQTFNKMGTEVPLYIGIFIIFFGHTVNFVLALMGGLIHGLRLNFIEWYHYSFEGGGKRFNPLSLLKMD